MCGCVGVGVCECGCGCVGVTQVSKQAASPGR